MIIPGFDVEEAGEANGKQSKVSMAGRQARDVTALDRLDKQVNCCWWLVTDGIAVRQVMGLPSTDFNGDRHD